MGQPVLVVGQLEFRSFVKQVLPAGEFEVVAETQSATEALRFCMTRAFRLIVIWNDLVGRRGIDLAREITERCVRRRVLLVALTAADHLVAEAVRSGIAGFVTLREMRFVLPTAARWIADGVSYVSPDAQASVMRITRGGAAGVLYGLSDREKEVARMLASGKNRNEIAKVLGLKPGTVKTYIRQMARKRGAVSTAALARSFAEELSSGG